MHIYRNLWKVGGEIFETFYLWKVWLGCGMEKWCKDIEIGNFFLFYAFLTYLIFKKTCSSLFFFFCVCLTFISLLWLSNHSLTLQHSQFIFPKDKVLPVITVRKNDWGHLTTQHHVNSIVPPSKQYTSDAMLYSSAVVPHIYVSYF